MLKKSHKSNILLLIVIFFYACNTARRVPPGRALLKENYVRGVTRDLAEVLESQIRQQPNRKILYTTKFFLGVYNTFDTTHRKTWLRKKLIRIGEEPVIYDSTLNTPSAGNIKQTLFNMGYFDAEVTWKDTLVGKKHNYAKVYYDVKQNNSYTISKVNYYVGDRYLDSVINSELGDSYIKVGHIFYKADFDAERSRITNQVKNLGYYFFNKEYIYFQVDSFADSLKVHVKVIIENPEQFSEHKVYKISNIYITIENVNPFRLPDPAYGYFKGYYIKRNGFNIARDVLLTKVFIYKDEIYRQKNTVATYEHLNDLQLFRYINIIYKVDTTHWVHTIIHDELKGDYEFYGDTTGEQPSLVCYINMTPSSKYEVVIEPQGILSDQNSFAGNHNTNYGGAMNALFRNKNVLTKGETFQLTASGALAYSFNNNKKLFKDTFDYKEYGIDAALKIPKIIFPGNYKFIDSRDANTTLNLNYAFESFREFKRDVFSTAIRYQAVLFKSYTINFSLIDVSYIQSKILDAEYARRINANTLTRIQFQPKFIVSTKLNALLNSKLIINSIPLYSIRIGLESSGFLLHEFSKALNTPYDTSIKAYKLFGVPYSQFYRSDLEFRYNYKFRTFSRFAARVYLGTVFPDKNSEYTGVPFEKRFFVGGTNDLRGWRIRKIGPGAYYDTIDFNRAGDIKIMFNAEFRKTFYKVFSYGLFVDVGNVWNLKFDPSKEGAEFNISKFYKQFAMDMGIGLRIDLEFFIFRLDAALPTYDPRPPDTGKTKWVFSKFESGKNWSKNFNFINLNAAIGFPF